MTRYYVGIQEEKSRRRRRRRRTVATQMVSDQGAAIVTGGGLICSDCKVQVKKGELNGSGQCAGCAS